MSTLHFTLPLSEMGNSTKVLKDVQLGTRAGSHRLPLRDGSFEDRTAALENINS